MQVQIALRRLPFLTDERRRSVDRRSRRIDDVVWCDRSGPAPRIVDASGEIGETGRNEKRRKGSWKLEEKDVFPFLSTLWRETRSFPSDRANIGEDTCQREGASEWPRAEEVSATVPALLLFWQVRSTSLCVRYHSATVPHDTIPLFGCIQVLLSSVHTSGTYKIRPWRSGEAAMPPCLGALRVLVLAERGPREGAHVQCSWANTRRMWTA